MSELQIGLLGIGIAIIAGVFAYNKWQEARFRREARAHLESPLQDVLLQSGGAAQARIEPTLADGTSSRTQTDPRRATGPSSDAASPAPLSEQLDAIVVLDSETEHTGQAIIDLVSSSKKDPRRRVRVEGEAQGAWESLNPRGRYRRVRIGMQLVDRRGTATPEEIEAFAGAAGNIAGSLQCRFEPVDVPSAVLAAGELDRFCGEVDIQIAVHVVSQGDAFAGTQIRALTESSGLAIGDDGRFSLRDEEGRVLFSLANGEGTAFGPELMRDLSTSTLLLELDVPRAPGGASTFARFREFAQHLATALGARLVDDNQAVLGEAAFQAIAVQLAPVYEAMESRGIPPGGPLALRLFS